MNTARCAVSALPLLLWSADCGATFETAGVESETRIDELRPSETATYPMRVIAHSRRELDAHPMLEIDIRVAALDETEAGLPRGADLVHAELVCNVTVDWTDQLIDRTASESIRSQGYLKLDLDRRAPFDVDCMLVMQPEIVHGSVTVNWDAHAGASWDSKDGHLRLELLVDERADE
jgi:hypothetical protein